MTGGLERYSSPASWLPWPVRHLIDDEGAWWFVAADVAPRLGYGHVPSAIRRLPARYHKQIPYDLVNSTVRQECAIGYRRPPHPPTITVVSEAGLYRLILDSDKPEARAFQDWLCDEVLPSISEHGFYMTAQCLEDIVNDPDALIRLALDLKTERVRRMNEIGV